MFVSRLIPSSFLATALAFGAAGPSQRHSADHLSERQLTEPSATMKARSWR